MIDLVTICTDYLKSNLTLRNTFAFQSNQNSLLDAAFQFVLKNKGQLVKTDFWNEMEKNHPELLMKVWSQTMQI